MGRRENRIFKLNDEIARVGEELRLAQEEIWFHRNLNDDAVRDAAVSDSPIDREDARETGADVARFERLIDTLQDRIDDLEAKRAKLLDKLS